MSTRQRIIGVTVALIITLLGVQLAMASTTYRSQTDLLADPGKYDGDTVYIGGYAQLVGTTYWHDYEEDVVSVTYKVYQTADLAGPFVFAVVNDRNRSDSGDNLPTPLALASGYLVLKGKWSQDNLVASPDVTPGQPAWSINVEGFDG